MLSRVVTNGGGYNGALRKNEAEAAYQSAKTAGANKEEKADTKTVLQDRYDGSVVRTKAATYTASSVAKMFQNRYGKSDEPAETNYTAENIMKVIQEKYAKKSEPSKASVYAATSSADYSSRFWSVKSDFWRP